jgi:hypothetical protein
VSVSGGMSERVLNAEGRSYAITERHGVVRNVVRRGEKLVVNCGGSSRTIETQEASVAAEDGNGFAWWPIRKRSAV